MHSMSSPSRSMSGALEPDASVSSPHPDIRENAAQRDAELSDHHSTLHPRHLFVFSLRLIRHLPGVSPLKERLEVSSTSLLDGALQLSVDHLIVGGAFN